MDTSATSIHYPKGRDKTNAIIKRLCTAPSVVTIQPLTLSILAGSSENVCGTTERLCLVFRVSGAFYLKATIASDRSGRVVIRAFVVATLVTLDVERTDRDRELVILSQIFLLGAVIETTINIVIGTNIEALGFGNVPCFPDMV